MEISRSDVEDAALVLLVAEDGTYRWSSTKTRGEVSEQLIKIGIDIAVGSQERE